MGGDHRTHGLVKSFPDWGDRVTRFCQGGSPAMYRALDLRRRVQIADDYVEYRHLNLVHEVGKAPMLVGYPNLLAPYALQLASDGLDDLLCDADVVLAREPWQIPYVLDHTPDETPIVFSSHNVESERFGDIRQPVLADRTLRRVKHLERRAVEETDALVCTAERDVETYRNLYDVPGEYIVAPNGTYEADLRDHRPDSADAHAVRDEYDIPTNALVCLFVGSEYKPNVEAARAAAEAVKSLAEREPPVHFLVVGGVGKALDDGPSVTTTGYIESGEAFEAHFDAADIALNPTLSGGGTNIKLVDYFARSLPVISTPFGVRGTAAADGESVIVAEMDAFPSAIDALGLNPERRRRIGERARQLAAEQYTWEAASRLLRERLYDLFGPF
jgi:glycosyltransferase involved in cell wall biosynthesis